MIDPISDAPEAPIAEIRSNLRKHHDFQSTVLTEPRDLVVYVPPGYDRDTARRYPVLYLHDGQNLFEGAAAFVPGQDWHVSETAEELKPFIDGEYRTLPDAANTGLGGSSLGGLVTLYLGLQHPNIYGKLAVLSPSVWWDNRVILKIVRMTDPKPRLSIWLDIGTGEGGKTVRDARALRDELAKAGWVLGSDLVYAEIPDAGHNEAAWAGRVGPFLNFLFPAHKPHEPLRVNL